MDRQLDAPTQEDQPPPRLYDLKVDQAEKHNLALQHPEIVKSLTEKHDAWFTNVLSEWRLSRSRILDHDKSYWQNREAPDPVTLFQDFWLWNKAPAGTDPRAANPLEVFEGFWTNEEPPN